MGEKIEVATIKLFLLGPPYLERGGEAIVIQRRKAMALLIYLAVKGEAQRRDTLATLLWPDSPTKQAHGSLRRTLSELNKIPGEAWVKSDREMVGLAPSPDLWLDVVQFQQYLADYPKATPAQLDLLSEGVKLYRDDFLTGFTLPDCPDFDEWQFFQAEGFRQTLAGALERLIHLHGQQGEFDQAIVYARRWLALDLLHEPAHRQLMTLYAQAGQQAAALRQYQLCSETLAAELGVPPAEETTALYERIRLGDFSRVVREQGNGEDFTLTGPPPPFHVLPSPALKPAAVVHNLPPRRTFFIGREEELAEILHLLRDESNCRLLTLIGPGGIGKTRLALRSARQSLNFFADGVYFVSLVGVSGSEFLVPTIVAALNISFSSGVDPKRQLLNYLRDKEMLLVLDNFEHLLAEVDFLSEMVQAAPQMKLLVTSRVRLNLQEEWGFEVEGLSYPVADEVQEQALESYSAVALFVERGRRAKTNFKLSPEDVPAVLQICRLVAGMPLGIELAAFWLRLMSCQEIAKRMTHSLDFLTTSIRNVQERHRSLRAVFESSWLLLSEDERKVFSQLSVFRSGFHSRAAERVVGATLPLLLTLADKSLLRRDRNGRYVVHGLLRQFAAEKLQERPGESEQVRDRHCFYFASFLQAREPHLIGPGQKETFQVMMTEVDNIRAAWRWAIEQGHVETAGKFLESFDTIVDIRGWFHEMAHVFDKAITRLKAQLEAGDEVLRVSSEQVGLLLGRLLYIQGGFYARLGLLERAETLHKESLARLAGLKPDPGQVRAYTEAKLYLGHLYHQQGNFAGAAALYREALAYFKQSGDRSTVASIKGSLGLNTFYLGQYSEAERLLQRGIAIYENMGEERHKAFFLHSLGDFVYAQAQGDYQRAEKLVQESLRISRELDDRIGTGFALMHLGAVMAAAGNYVRARQTYQESLAIARDSDTRMMKLGSLNGLGAVALAQGQYEEARQWYEESVTFSHQVGQGKHAPEALIGLGNIACLLAEYTQAKHYFAQALQTPIRSFGETLEAVAGVAHLLSKLQEPGKAIELLALVLHHPASLHATQARAARLLEELAALVPPEVMTAAKKRGQALNLEVTVGELVNSLFL